jgi:hypothetical protein
LPPFTAEHSGCPAPSEWRRGLRETSRRDTIDWTRTSCRYQIRFSPDTPPQFSSCNLPPNHTGHVCVGDYRRHKELVKRGPPRIHEIPIGNSQAMVNNEAVVAARAHASALRQLGRRRSQPERRPFATILPAVFTRITAASRIGSIGIVTAGEWSHEDRIHSCASGNIYSAPPFASALN